MQKTIRSLMPPSEGETRRKRSPHNGFRDASVHCSIAINDNDSLARKGLTIMKHLKSRSLIAGLALAFLASSFVQAADKDNKGKGQSQPKQQPPRQSQQGQSRQEQRAADQRAADQKRQEQQKAADLKRQEQKAQDQRRAQDQKAQRDQENQRRDRQEQERKAKEQQEREAKDRQEQNRLEKAQEQSRQQLKLQTKTTADGGYEKTAPSGRVREKVEKKDDGEHTKQFTATGRVEKEEVKRSNGEKRTTDFDLGGKVKREEVVRPDGSKEVTNQQRGRDGDVRVKETVKYDVRQKVVSKTVVKNVNKTVIVNNYDRGHYGYVYRPVRVHPRFYVSWYDPFWYSPVGVTVAIHPFRFSWGWGSFGWYHRYHGVYFSCYDVYPTPSYWLTDWMVADYVNDRYSASVSAAQAREDARLAREEAEKARRAAQEARDAAEIAEAKAAQAQAELRARNAEDRAARAEREEARAGKPNPNATPIDKETKEALKNQIEQTIAEKKAYAEEVEKGGNPLPPDVSKALADPKHIYPVSKSISVVSANDLAPAGNLSEGDLLKIEPGQEATLKNANENTFVTMRVMTSKGDEGEVAAGTLISLPIKDLQEFDSEFRAKLDEGLAEAEKNKDKFKQAAQQQ